MYSRLQVNTVQSRESIEGDNESISSETGQITDTYNYDAYGKLLNSTGSSDNSYLYQGEQFDSNLDLQ
ncbi:hypothetical protein [Microcoleus sp. N3A4]|uniref:hypothetical protein n=1 Tax=Microcoleus sp. N3A4 TaxID=3055379 RepID=UPI002FD4A54D